MENFTFAYPAGAPAATRALAGVVGSGDLEVLAEPGAKGTTTIRVTTSVQGYEHVWQAQLDRLFGAGVLPALSLDIHDFGATPGVVGLRIAQVLDAVSAAGTP